jgi:hypothetical protein
MGGLLWGSYMLALKGFPVQINFISRQQMHVHGTILVVVVLADPPARAESQRRSTSPASTAFEKPYAITSLSQLPVILVAKRKLLEVQLVRFLVLFTDFWPVHPWVDLQRQASM